MSLVVDTHAHLQDPAFAAELDDVLARAAANDLVAIVNCGYDPESNVATLRQAERSPLLFPAVGYHPHEAKDITPALLAELETLAREDSVVAIGEIGLDFYRDHSPHDLQRALLDAELAIALRLARPVSLHTRGAEAAIEPQLAEYSRASGWQPGGRPIGVMHCFGGTLDQARRYVDLGFLVSFACTLTYPRNDQARTIAADLPLESIVVETDSPYLPPQQLRGKRNEPANVRRAVEAIAAARGISVAAAAEATTRNATALFALSLSSNKVAAR